jgi:DNA-binding GntR family transcriptional regulator
MDMYSSSGGWYSWDMASRGNLGNADIVEGSASVYLTLRQRIADGELPPGAPLTELGLANEFGISRTPVREAMNRLQYDGLLERDSRGMRVRALDSEEVLDIYEVRIALESAAARAAAQRRSDFDLAKLRSEIDAMDKLDLADEAGRSPLAFSFHFAVWNASHNPTLIEALQRLHVKVVGLASTTLVYPGRWEAVVRECRELVDAIERRDVEAAGQIGSAHMTAARDTRLHIYSSSMQSPSAELIVNRKLLAPSRAKGS